MLKIDWRKSFVLSTHLYIYCFGYVGRRLWLLIVNQPVLELWVDTEINFYNLIHTALLQPNKYVLSTNTSFLSSSSDVLARHIEQQLQASRKIFSGSFQVRRKISLDVLLHDICVTDLEALWTRNAFLFCVFFTWWYHVYVDDFHKLFI